MPSWFDFSVKIWPKRFENAPKSAQGTDQEPPEKRPRGILEPTWAQMFSVFEQFWHKIEDLSDLDAILVPFWRESLTKTLPRCSEVGPRNRPRAARKAPKTNLGANLGSNGVQTQRKYAPWTYFVFDVNSKLISKWFWSHLLCKLRLKQMQKEDAKHLTSYQNHGRSEHKFVGRCSLCRTHGPFHTSKHKTAKPSKFSKLRNEGSAAVAEASK